MASGKAVVVALHASATSFHSTLFVPGNLLAVLKIRVGQLTTLSFGRRKHQVQVQIIDRKLLPQSSAILISPDVFRYLKIPAGISVHLQKKENDVRLGPVVGILANVRLKDGTLTGIQVPVFEKLISNAVNQRAFAFVFSPKEVSFQDGQLLGYVWQENNGWQRAELPLPDVVYDQVISRRFAEDLKVKEFYQKFKRLTNASYFNPTFFDKWQVHNWLWQDPVSRVYLPETLHYESASDAAQFLNIHRDVYVKPVNGSLGVGIIRVQRLGNGKFHYQIKSKNHISKEGSVTTSTDVFSALSKRVKKGQYIVQKGLNLLTYRGRPFDIRILMQKDHHGKWRRTKSFCRIAQEGDITSNLSTGGDALPVQKVLSETLHDTSAIKRIQGNISTLVRVVPEAIEKNSGLLLGELGLDVGVDINGGVWLIEANSRPWKKPTTEQGSMNLVNQSFTRPIQYAKYLAGF